MRATDVTFTLGASVRMKALTTAALSGPSPSSVISESSGSLTEAHVDGGLRAWDASAPPPICVCSLESSSGVGCVVTESGNQPACTERPSTEMGGRSSIKS